MKCLDRFKRFSQRNFLYSSKSHYLLNYYTLKIGDEEIEENFISHRLECYKKLLLPYITLALILFLWRLASLLFTRNGDAIQTIQSAQILLTLLLSKILSRKVPHILQEFIFCTVVFSGIVTNLAARDKLPDALKTQNKSNHDFVLILVYFLTTSLNMNSFKFTAFVTSPTFLIAYLFQQIAHQQSL